MGVSRRGLATRMVALILVGAGLVLLVLVSVSYVMQRRTILSDAAREGVTLASSLAYQIESALGRAQATVHQTGLVLARGLPDRANCARLVKDTLEANPALFGMAVALSPETAADHDFAILYGWRDGDTVTVGDREEPAADYQADWFYLPYHLHRPAWTEPYYDSDAGTLMVTYAAPVLAGERVLAVVTCDFSLEDMRGLLAGLPLGDHGIAVLLSERGTYIVHPEPRVEMRESVFSLAESLGDTADGRALHQLGLDMLSGTPGYRFYNRPLDGAAACIYYHAVPSTGWALGIIKPDYEVLAPVRRLNRVSMAVGAAGLLLLLFPALLIAWSVARPLGRLANAAQRLSTGDFETPVPAVDSCDEVSRLAGSFEQMRLELRRYMEDLTATTAAKERIATELSAAREIQMSIVPKLFPPFPERPEIDLYAVLIPALEVGGDLYDFALLDEDHLYVAIGDVSGKGIPASLLMAVGKTLLKSTMQTVRAPARAMAMVNEELAEGNDSCMFITMFCGILNLKTGDFIYTNAGHNPPVLSHPSGSVDHLESPPSPPLGIVPGHVYEDHSLRMDSGDMLVLYTDGVSEAMNPDNVMYGVEGLVGYLDRAGGEGAKSFVEGLGRAVHTHANGAPQSDDITALAVRFLAPGTASDAGGASEQPVTRPPDAVLTLASSLDELPRLTAWLEAQAEAQGVAPALVMKLNLVLEEWFVNVVSYAWPGGGEHGVEMKLWREGDALVFVVEDEGIPFDPTAQAEVDTDLSLEHRQIGGLGIHFIRSNMDRFTYRREGNRNIVTLVKRLDAPTG